MTAQAQYDVCVHLEVEIGDYDMRSGGGVSFDETEEDKEDDDRSEE
jgi:hypothetical protein